MIQLLKRYLKASWVPVLCVFVFSALQVVCQLLLPQITDRILKRGVTAGDMAYIYRMGFLMLMMVVGVGLCMIASGYFSARVTAEFTCGIRDGLFRKIRTFRSPDYARFGEATLLTRSTTDVTLMQIMMINSLRAALLVPFTGIGALIVAIQMNWMLTLVVLIAFVLTLLFVQFCFSRSRPAFKELQGSTDRINLLAGEKLTGARHIRAFHREKYEAERMEKANEEAFQNAIRANRSINFLSPAMQMVMNLTIVAVYYMGAVQIQKSMMDTADLIKFLQYILNFVSSLTTISSILTFIPKATVSAERVLEVLDYETAPGGGDGKISPASGGARICFDRVSFGYAGAKEQVIRDVSFCVEPGETLAILGATGAGKTTLLALLLRLYDISGGSITIDGQEASSLDLDAYRSLFSYAPQKAMILQKTVYENLQVANAGLSREQAMEALADAEAAEVVNGLPEGLDTMMAQNGMNISGGQRQRLSIARALARDAQVYLFDDTFSALDMKTDARVRANIKRRLQGKTVVIVAQRIATIRHADKILLMDNGRAAACGTHEELLGSSPLYREIYETQSYAGEEAQPL